VPRPRRYDDATRLHLIERAAALLTAEGPHALTTRRVASEAGTSTSALYSLIGGKEELLREMYREGFARLAAAFDAVPVSDDAVADYWEMGRAYVAHALDNPGLYAVMFSTPAPEFTPSQEDADFAWTTFEANIAAAQRCIDAGAFAGDATDVATQMWAISHGIAALTLVGMLTPEDAVRQHEGLLDACAVGRRPRAGSASAAAQ
jgi:AcrR family transcriptional regulator